MKKTASISALIVAFSAVAGLAVMSTACGDDDTSNPAGSSTSGGTSGTSGATSGGTSGATSGGTSGGTSGSTSGAPSLDAQYKALCDSQKKCGPNAFAANFAADADCVTFFKSSATGGDPLPGTPTLTQAQIDACTAKYTSRVCGDFTVPAECEFKGTLAKDAACNSPSQCSGGACTKAAATDNCGKCADAPAAPTPKAKGDTCAAGDTCASGLSCQGVTGAQKCDTIKQIGDTCTGGTTIGECALGTTCTDGKCAEMKYAKDGEKCGLDGSTFVLCGVLTHTCVDAKCVANGKEGDACEAPGATPTKPACGGGLTCTDGKCAKPKAVEVCK